MKDILKCVKKRINEYYYREFKELINNEKFYDNIEELGIAYTTDEYDNEIQVSTDVLNKSVLTYVNGTLLECYKYNSWTDYLEYLNHLDFDEQIMVAEDVYEDWKRGME